MITLKSRLLHGAVFSVVALALGTAALAQEATMSRRADSPRRPATFTVSGTFTGSLSGQVVISGVTYRLSESPQVFQLGVGPVPMGSVPIGSLVYATGTGSADGGTVLALVARPAGEASDDANAVSPKIREMSPTSPK